MEEEKKLKILPNKQMQDMHDISPVNEFYSSLKDVIDIENRKSPFGDFLLHSVEGGEKKVYYSNTKETKIFKVNYIDVLETGYEHISRIIKNPKSGIKYLQEVVIVAKAKKVNSDTVRHLASHTQYIREIQDDGFVIPSKLLTTYAEEEKAIYENRFLKTLLNRIDIFLKMRYDILKDNLESYEQDRLRIENNFSIDGKKIDFKMEIGVRRDIPENVVEAKKAFAKIVNLRDLFGGLKSSPFIRELQKSRDVRPPIMKTNIILHNPDFIVCYNLWMFLDRYVSQDYDVDVKEITKPYTKEFDRQMNNISTFVVANMLYYNDLNKFNLDDIKMSSKVKKAPVRLDKPKYNISLEPESIQLEDNVPKEYFLNETRKFYEKTYEDIEEDNPDSTENVNFGKAYKEILRSVSVISENLYVQETEDMDEDLPMDIQLRNANKRLRVTKLTNRIKREDLDRTQRLETRYEKSVEQLKADIEKQRIIEEREKAREDARRKAEELKEKRRLEKEERQKQMEIRAAERKAAKAARARAAAEARKQKRLEQKAKKEAEIKRKKDAERALHDKKANAKLAKEIYEKSLKEQSNKDKDLEEVKESNNSNLEEESSQPSTTNKKASDSDDK